MRPSTMIFLSLLLGSCNAQQTDMGQLKASDDSLRHKLTGAERSGNVELRNTTVRQITSRNTQVAYDVYVSYPHNYEQAGKKYPVLVVLDAEVNFGAISYIVQRLIKDRLIPEIFVVGIAYRGETSEDTYYSLRCRDFTATSDEGFLKVHENYTAGAGGAEYFTKFLSEELFPLLQESYPVLDDNRALYGHSFGGLFGARLLMDHPDMFDRYLLLSPSLWWDGRNTLKKMKVNSSIDPTVAKVYVATGALEGNMVDDHLEMVRLVRAANPDDLKMKSEILDNETHRTIFGRGFTNGLRFLYAGE